MGGHQRVFLAERTFLKNRKSSSWQTQNDLIEVTTEVPTEVTPAPDLVTPAGVTPVGVTPAGSQGADLLTEVADLSLAKLISLWRAVWGASSLALGKSQSTIHAPVVMWRARRFCV